MADQWTPVDDGRAGAWAPVQEASAPAPASGWAPVSEDTTESSWKPWIEGAAGLAAGAGLLALTRNPEAAASVAGKAAGAFQDVRRASMLSGLAPLKSFLGNIGGTAYESIERGSWEPLKELLSPETAKDAWQTYKAGPNYAATGPSNLSGGLSELPIIKYLHPGRVMGAFDTAAQNALMRSGLTDQEAARTMLQAPLPHGLAKAMDNPAMNYLVPFRRTPWNQFIEGGKTFGASTTGQKLALGTSLATGAATGAMADDPKTIGLGTALSGRYGLPFTLAAGMTRGMSTGSKAKGAEAIQGASPLSDYSLADGVVGPVTNPSTLIPKPAALSAWDYLKSLIGQ